MTEPLGDARIAVGSTSSSLLERVKAHDEAAWRQLVGLYGPLVLYWCRSAGVLPADCVDVCQEVFRAVAGSIGDFRRDPALGTFRGWLRTITRSKVASHFRRQNRQPAALGGSDAQEQFFAIPAADTATTPEASDREKAIVVRQALDLIRPEFEERTWQAFWRATVESQASAVVADALGMSAGAVRQAKSRVLHRLRVQLHELLEEGASDDGCIPNPEP